MRRSIIGLVAGVLLFAAGPAAHAGTAGGCLILTETYMTGASAGIVWGFSSGGGIRFQPDGLYFDNEAHTDPLTPAQLAGYATVLEDFRAAATGKKRLNIHWDDANRKIWSVEVLWTQSC